MSVLIQIWIAITGLAAVALLQFGDERQRRAAPWIGLAGQPAWIAHAQQTEALGVAVVVVAYTVLWMVGCVATIGGKRG